MSLPDDVTSGMDLRKALVLARSLDCHVRPVKRTGETRVSHRSISKSIKINGRRNDCPRALTQFLRALLRTAND
jgi:hypothetical protein